MTLSEFRELLPFARCEISFQSAKFAANSSNGPSYVTGKELVLQTVKDQLITVHFKQFLSGTEQLLFSSWRIPFQRFPPMTP